MERPADQRFQGAQLRRRSIQGRLSSDGQAGPQRPVTNADGYGGGATHSAPMSHGARQGMNARDAVVNRVLDRLGAEDYNPVPASPEFLLR